jgi:hypothetical protein
MAENSLLVIGCRTGKKGTTRKTKMKLDGKYKDGSWRYRIERYGLDLSGSGTFGLHKCWEAVEWLHNWWALDQGSTP